MPWKIKPQTSVKHRILVEYLNRWIPILAQRNKRGSRVVYVDAFAGPGIYSGGEPGSPIIAITAALDHVRLPDLLRRPEFHMTFLFIEKDNEAREDLRQQIDLLKEGRTIPDSFTIAEPILGEFSEKMTEVLDVLAEQGKKLAPTLVFIDPFGPLGFPLRTIRRILENRSCEVLVRFNYTRMANTFMRRPEMASRLDEVFESADWRSAPQDPAMREKFTLDLYCDRLKEYGGARHIQPFRTADPSGRVAYFIFATCSQRGFGEMKEAMWKVDPSGGFRWRAAEQPPPGQANFFGQLADSVCQAQVIAELPTEFAGRRVQVNDLEAFVRCQPDWLIRHLRPALKSLEDQHVILSVEREARMRRKGTFPPDAFVRFK